MAKLSELFGRIFGREKGKQLQPTTPEQHHGDEEMNELLLQIAKKFEPELRDNAIEEISGRTIDDIHKEWSSTTDTIVVHNAEKLYRVIRNVHEGFSTASGEKVPTSKSISLMLVDYSPYAPNDDRMVTIKDIQSFEPGHTSHTRGAEAHGPLRDDDEIKQYLGEIASAEIDIKATGTLFDLMLAHRLNTDLPFNTQQFTWKYQNKPRPQQEK